jgi:trans-aconitate methyltransferase
MMAATAPRSYWNDVHRRRDPTEASWYQAEPTVSLELIDELGVYEHEPVVDVGGGTSPLAARLLERGFEDVTVLDVSEASLERAQERLGTRAGDVSWLRQDIRSWRPERLYGLWHDRALFHFLVAAPDRARYLEALRQALAPGGAVVIATFAPDGPDHCSGLPVARYDAAGLASLLGPSFELVAERREQHRTPAGTAQRFAWAALRARRRVT